MRPSTPTIERVEAEAFTVPTDGPEADGTFAWGETTLVLCRVVAGGETGLGFSYTGAAAVGLIAGPLRKAVGGLSAFDPPRTWTACGGRFATSAAPASRT